MTGRYVIDASVAAKWVLAEPGRAAVTRYLDAWGRGDVDLLAPDILLPECASLLARRTRRRQISADQARAAFAALVARSPRLVETRPRLNRALDLSLTATLSLWDAIYVTLAAERRCPLVTADKRLAHAAAGHAAIELLDCQVP
jgi:predicted nucleic acid-binding protein